MSEATVKGTAFTPGPWTVQHGPLQSNIFAGVVRRAIVSCDQYSGVVEKGECHANAHLVGAAPAMFAFIDTISRFTKPNGDPVDDAATLNNLIDRARDLRKQATGA